jgi:hypothetical protein
MVKYLRSQAISWWKIIVNFRHKFLVQSRIFISEWIEWREECVVMKDFLVDFGERIYIQCLVLREDGLIHTLLLSGKENFNRISKTSLEAKYQIIPLFQKLTESSKSN